MSLFSVFDRNDRIGATDILPHLATEKAEIFIKTMDETIHWQIFVDSLSTNSWLLIIIVAIGISLLLSLVDGSLNVGKKVFILPRYLGNLWIAIKANFGGKPGSGFLYCLTKKLCFRPQRWRCEQLFCNTTTKKVLLY